jgi:uncharacterized membrane protein (DUF106 family)
MEVPAAGLYNILQIIFGYSKSCLYICIVNQIMFNLISPLILKSKNFLIGVIGIITLLFIISFVNNYFEAQNKVKEYKRIEQETKEFHQEKIQELKTTLIKRRNAKKIDYNDGGNLDDDFLLKSLE